MFRVGLKGHQFMHVTLQLSLSFLFLSTIFKILHTFVISFFFLQILTLMHRAALKNVIHERKVPEKKSQQKEETI